MRGVLVPAPAGRSLTASATTSTASRTDLDGLSHPGVGGGEDPRAWQRMLSGRRLDLLDPSPLDVEVEDIAHGLAFVARWNGQTRGEHPYSVAEHSLLVEDLDGRAGAERPEPRWRLAALLHDAPEYVIGDMISPVKGAVGPRLRRARRPAGARRARALRAAGRAAGDGQVGDQARRPDVGLARGGTQLAGFTAAEADRFFGIPRIEGLGSTTPCICVRLGRGQGRLPRPPCRAYRGVPGRAHRSCTLRRRLIILILRCKSLWPLT